MGAAHWYVVCGLTGLGCLAILSFASYFKEDWTPVATICTALALWTGISLLPVPMKLLHLLSPEAATTWSDSLRYFNKPAPGWATISLDPIATTQEVAKWCFYACSTLAAGQIARRRSLQHVLAVVWGISVLVAFITLFQSLTQITSVLGIYAPLHEGRAQVASVLLNPNNLAGFTNLGTFCGLGMVLSARPLLPTAAVSTGCVVLVVTTFLTGSRGGVGMLILGIATFAVLMMRSQQRVSFSPSVMLGKFSSLLPIVIILCCTGALLAVGITNATWQEILGDDFSKIHSVERLREGIAEYWIFGIGRGSFETVSFRYLGDQDNTIYRSVENFLASWMIEWGVPCAVIAFGSLVWLARPSRLATKSRPAAQAALIGIVVLTGQNFVDLGFEVLSITGTGFAVLRRAGIHARLSTQQTITNAEASRRNQNRRIARSHRGACFGNSWSGRLYVEA